MKTMNFLGSVLVLAAGISSCAGNRDDRFLNLTSGEEVTLVKDDYGNMIDKDKHTPVLLYVDTKAHDTIYGPSGKVVNGKLEKLDDGVYVYDAGEKKIKIDGDEYKMKDGEIKEKIEGEEYKYKDESTTIKADGDEYKEESKGYLKKVDEDGDVKVKTGDKVYKTDGETGEKTVKKRSVFGKLKDKVTEH